MTTTNAADTHTSIVEFTAAALDKLGEVLSEQDAKDAYLRISAESNDNGGVQYGFSLETEPAPGDTSIVSGSVKAIVDPDSVPLISGSKIDYVEGFQRSGFVIANPNFAGGCACGGGGCGCGG